MSKTPHRLFRCTVRHAWLAVAIAIGGCGERPAALAGLEGNPERGRVALTQYACHACHQIPGVTGSKVFVGPPLRGIASRKYIAGSLPNTPVNLARWIRDPKQIDPMTAMPVMGVGEADLNNIVAYLLTLR